MRRSQLYETIRPLFLREQITTFQQLFTHIPDTAVANRLGKRTERFRELAENVDEFKIEEIVLMAKLFHLELSQMFRLVEPDLARIYKERVIKKNLSGNIVAMYEEKKILKLTDVFKYLTMRETAEAIGARKERFGKIKTAIKKLPLQLPLDVGLFGNLSIPATLKLIEAEYIEQSKVPKLS